MSGIPQFVGAVLKEWEGVACFAYDEYERQGRGVVTIEPDGSGDARLMYGPADFFQQEQQTEVIRLLEMYDPVREFLVLFQDTPARTRTLRIRTPEGRRNPKGIWFFKMLERFDEQPDALPDHLPEWFFRALEDLQSAKRAEAGPRGGADAG